MWCCCINVYLSVIRGTDINSHSVRLAISNHLVAGLCTTILHSTFGLVKLPGAWSSFRISLTDQVTFIEYFEWCHTETHAMTKLFNFYMDINIESTVKHAVVENNCNLQYVLLDGSTVTYVNFGCCVMSHWYGELIMVWHGSFIQLDLWTIRLLCD